MVEAARKLSIAPDVTPDEVSPHALFLRTPAFGSLDGLRAIAILMVVWHHTHGGISQWPISRRGFIGVDLFFVISGFLIVTLILRERRKTGGTSLSRFYLRRFLRIFPPYYTALLLVTLAALLKKGTTSWAILHDAPYALVYVSNLVPMVSLLSITWSLSTEEQFYLVVPTVEKLAPSVFPKLLPVAYVLVALPPFGLLPSLHLPNFFRETTFGPILLGVMLAHALDNPRGFRWVYRVAGAWWSPIPALCAFVISLSYPGEDISGWPRLVIHVAIVCLVASCVVREDHALRPPLSFRPLQRIGVVSYGIYLYHLIVAHFVQRGMIRLGFSTQLLSFVGTSLGTWLVAEASYRLFESRILALKSRFAA